MSPSLRSASAIAVLAALAAGPVVAAGEATRAVRVPGSDAEAVQALVPTARGTDYGSFRWFELSAAEHARLASSGLGFEDVPDAWVVGIGHWRFDPLVDGEPVTRAGGEASGPRLRLVQFAGPTKDEWLTALSSAGLRVLQYYAHHTYLVWGEAPAAAAASAMPFVRWQGLFHPEYKVSPELASKRGLVRNVDVTFYDAGDPAATLRALEAHGARLLAAHPAQPDRAFWDAIVEVDASALGAMARLPEVWWLGYESPHPTLDDEMSSQILAGNHPGGTPVTGYSAWLASVGLNGAGVTWAVIDTGVDYDHPDLGPHIVGGHDFPGACTQAGNPGSDCSGGGHGTHVAGIVGGDASGVFTDTGGFLYGLGIAPQVGFFAMNSLSASAWPPSGGWQEHSKRAVLGGAIGGNNSWTTGEGTAHGYQASERTHDFMVRDGNFDTGGVAEPFIEVFSAGNSGPGASTLTSPKEAKNLVVVANSLNFRAGSIDSIANGSSRGPAVDGRIGVTVAAPGSTIASARNDLGGSCSTAIPGTDGLYAFCSGTSMAAPHAAGAIVLLTEWWRGLAEGGADPSPAMARALLVNGAVDMATPNVPNASEGWGRVNIPNVVASGAARYYVDQTTILGQTGEAVEIVVGVPDPGAPLKVTLAWSDAPGGVGANPALVNDLDLEVETDGNTYLGNVFTAGWSTPGGTRDALHNLENVFVAGPGGAATITVRGFNIAGDGVPFTGDGTDQDFALVCHNCVEEPTYTLSAAPEAQAVCAPSDAVYTVEVGSILGYSDPVTLSVTGHPIGTTAVFSTNPVTPGGSSLLTIGDTGSAAAGSSTLALEAVSTAGSRARDLRLDIFAAAPGTAGLLSPADGAVGVLADATFAWQPAPNGGSYAIEVATDPAFTDIVASATGLTAPSWQASNLPTTAQLYWRVQATNACGTSAHYPTFSFVTESLPGDCDFGVTALLPFADDLESGAVGWTTGGSNSTWVLSGSNVHSGANAFHAEGSPSVSDQYLVSPPVDLPGHPQLTLQFWNFQWLEDRTGGCWDGGVVEISSDAGASWVRLEDELLTDPYDGPVGGTTNPLAGTNAWCGDPQDWLESVVDLAAFGGQTVQFRFRLGTDGSVGRDGWRIDDVIVQACDTAVFVDGFESGDTSGGWGL